jgi:preprotein translocase subunit SecE
MALVTKDDEGSEPMADDDREDEIPEEPERDEAAEPLPESRKGGAAMPPAAPPTGGFFHLYKPGQGYWTRLGTAIGVGLLILLVARFLYVALETRTSLDMYKDAVGNMVTSSFPVWKTSIVGVLTLIALFFSWKYLNGPTAVDFLIATESEMKKVNWTSRKDLLGSTKVVIIFMFLIAAILFLIDVAFGGFFFWIRVLKTGPFG